MQIDHLLRNQTAIRAALCVTLFSYGCFAWFVFDTAIAIHKPCITDFEGGCSYGKVWAGALSWLAAWPAVNLAIGVGAFAFVMPRFKKLLIAFSIVLTIPPFSYVLYGIYTITPVALELLQ